MQLPGIFGLLMLLLLCAPQTVFAAETSLLMTGDSGDWVGHGNTFFYTPADGTFSAQAGSLNSIAVSFYTPGYSTVWSLYFGAPYHEVLSTGVYEGALRSYSQAANTPMLSVYGAGRSCNTSRGTVRGQT